MKKHVIDASTLLAYLQDESASELAGQYCKGACISAVSLTEVFEKAIDRGGLGLVQAIVHQANLEVVPYTSEQAAMAAELYASTKGKSVSFADRACLALGKSLQLPVVSGDDDWDRLGLDIELVSFRIRSN